MAEGYLEEDSEESLECLVFPVTTVLLTKDFYRPVIQTDRLISISGQEFGTDQNYHVVTLPTGVTIAAFQNNRLHYFLDGEESEHAYGFMLLIQGIGDIGDVANLEEKCRVTAVMVIHEQERYFLKIGRHFSEERNISSAPAFHFERAIGVAKISLRKKLKKAGITNNFPYEVAFFSSYVDEQEIEQLEVKLRVGKLFREFNDGKRAN